jgi:hypothetical protein
MAVDIAPQAADAIDVLVALDVGEQAAFGPFDDKRLVLGHLREGVPDVGAVPRVELIMHGRNHFGLEWPINVRK